MTRRSMSDRPYCQHSTYLVWSVSDGTFTKLWMCRRALKRAVEQRRLAEEERGPMSDAADEEGSEGALDGGHSAGYDPLYSPPPTRGIQIPTIGSFIGSLRQKRVTESEWCAAASDEETGSLQIIPPYMAEGGAGQRWRAKGDVIPVHVQSQEQCVGNEGIELQVPRRSVESNVAAQGFRDRGVPGTGIACG